MKILFTVSEASPFIRTGGLGDVAGALPKALADLGNDCRVVMPLYEEIPTEYRQTMRFLGSTFVDLSWRRQYCGVFEYTIDNVIYYFIDNEYYFGRKGLYGHFDDGERFAFFSKAVLEMASITGFYPEIAHSNDWHTALVPVFLDIFYRGIDEYKRTKTVFTIHNIEFQGKYDRFLMGDILGIPAGKESIVECDEVVNYMKGGIESANVVTTVSKTYAEELKDPFFSYGLSGILNARHFKIKGVTNGIDTDFYNPQTDGALDQNYTLKSVKRRQENKKHLCELMDLPYSPERPMIAMITRLTEQKGMDLVATVLDEMLAADIQFIVLGKGDWKYETLLKNCEKRYSSKMRAIINFNGDLASKIYGSTDILLMPSKFEPCGLGQMIAMRYGAVPIVRETGGLKDTVEPFNPVTKKGTGFTFKAYQAYDMLDAVWRSLGAYYDKNLWNAVQTNAMKRDFSWKTSAKEYNEIYTELLK
ncbi:MAG: glycogen synthase GlgA [Clostridia bacterium]